ncbi:acyl-CoA thioesterase [Cryptosporangium arvum]|uniref:Acyl-CoA thioesterase n=1 Tax=Cryptosporangium arvum DSM 44712 TaxID=927661 RepID=A0A010YMR7_9ACTN|nr:acyl-CoA thioesterase [Cryptosporangium arvum DSM 44712]
MRVVTQTTTGAPTILDLFALDELEPGLYRAGTVFDEDFPLYGGQVAAQALRAAGLTVPDGRSPHSLHGYFLRGGDAGRPTDFRVEQDRDGRSYSARRVVAAQDGEVIFTMSCSFHVVEDGADRDVVPAPDVPHPSTLRTGPMPRMFSMLGALPPAPHPGSEWPTRWWARCVADLPSDALTHACVLTYLSDISTGLAPYHDESSSSGSSLDHALWFHRPIPLDEWVLMDLQGHSTAHGRGFYTGTIRSADGVLGATIAQEALFRSRERSIFTR